jgi:hypothetical protein
MECPHQLSFNEITNIETDEQNNSLTTDYSDDLNLMKGISFEEFFEDESTEISLILNSMDSNITLTVESCETGSVSEILAILKKSPNSAKNKNNDYINPFGKNICRPVCVKKVSLSGKVLSAPYPERVSKPVLKSSILTLNN